MKYNPDYHQSIVDNVRAEAAIDKIDTTHLTDEQIYTVFEESYFAPNPLEERLQTLRASIPTTSEPVKPLKSYYFACQFLDNLSRGFVVETSEGVDDAWQNAVNYTISNTWIQGMKSLTLTQILSHDKT